jgi:methionyl-tRNA synthetase
MPRTILVTSALPYVNGHLHIGHMVEHIQTDIWARFQRLSGHKVVALCGDDTHGTATMIRARQEQRSEGEIIREMSASHLRDIEGFGVAYDHYGSTDSPSNRTLVGETWAALRKGGHVAERDVTQLYDPKAGSFLADRFVKGTCPRCGARDQNGDSCDKCSATYDPTELKDAVSTLSGAKPELRTARHYFIELEPFRAFLEQWTQSDQHLHENMSRWIKNTFLGDKLRDWDISRPAPYSGFEIPDAPGNYFYVWFDAPLGYIAILTDWCAQDAKRGAPGSWWPKKGDAAFGKDPEVHHFIGKDIAYFHTLFWPAMLHAAGFQLPKMVHIHGFLTVNGEKMSKSKGTFVRARTYLDHLDPTHLRYYFASKLTPDAVDIDLNLEEFVAKVNSDLVGKFVNLASRTARFIPRLAAKYPDDGGLFAAGAAAADEIAAAYDAGDFNAAMRRIMGLADRANEFVEQAAPWTLKKDPAKAAELDRACSIALNLFRQLAIYLAPVLPKLAEQAGALLSTPITQWSDAQKPLVGVAIKPFERMLDRVDPVKVQAMIAASTENDNISKSQGTPMTTSTDVAADDGSALAAEPIAPTIAFEDFAKLDLRVARVLKAEEVAGAKKILKLTLSLGGTDQREVFAGIKTAYTPEQLVNRLIVFVANLAPKQMSFGVSNGMVLAAGPGGKDIFVLSPDSGAKVGQRVH